MSPAPTRVRLCALALAFAFLAGACGGGGAGDEGRDGEKVAALAGTFIPAEVLGLNVTTENTKDYVDAVNRSYMDEFGLYAFRKGDLLQATLQVIKFTEDANYEDPKFRGQLVTQIGSSKAQPFRMDETEIQLTTGTKQQIGIWFKDRYMFVMSIRDEYLQPRTLLRTVLEYKP